MANPIRFPSVEDVFNLARVYLNDTFLSGAGAVFVDTWSPNLVLLNAAIDTLQRDLELGGVPAKIKELVYSGTTALTPLNSSLGLSIPNPVVQQRLGFDGFDDGSGTVNTAIVLPTDLLAPLKLEQRNAGSGLTFTELAPAQDELISRYQDFSLGQWEFRGDSLGSVSIFFNGALISKDLRLRYQATASLISSTLSPSVFATTFIQLMDSLEPLAYRVAWLFAESRGAGAGAQNLLAQYTIQTNRLIARAVKKRQFGLWEREPFGQVGDTFGWWS